TNLMNTSSYSHSTGSRLLDRKQAMWEDWAILPDSGLDSEPQPVTGAQATHIYRTVRKIGYNDRDGHHKRVDQCAGQQRYSGPGSGEKHAGRTRPCCHRTSDRSSASWQPVSEL